MGKKKANFVFEYLWPVFSASIFESAVLFLNLLEKSSKHF